MALGGSDNPSLIRASHEGRVAPTRPPQQQPSTSDREARSAILSGREPALPLLPWSGGCSAAGPRAASASPRTCNANVCGSTQPLNATRRATARGACHVVHPPLPPYGRLADQLRIWPCHNCLDGLDDHMYTEPSRDRVRAEDLRNVAREGGLKQLGPADESMACNSSGEGMTMDCSSGSSRGGCLSRADRVQARAVARMCKLTADHLSADEIKNGALEFLSVGLDKPEGRESGLAKHPSNLDLILSDDRKQGTAGPRPSIESLGDELRSISVRSDIDRLSLHIDASNSSRQKSVFVEKFMGSKQAREIPRTLAEGVTCGGTAPCAPDEIVDRLAPSSLAVPQSTASQRGAFPILRANRRGDPVMPTIAAFGIDLGTGHLAVAYIDKSAKSEIIRNHEKKSSGPRVLRLDRDGLALGSVANGFWGEDNLRLAARLGKACTALTLLVSMLCRRRANTKTSLGSIRKSLPGPVRQFQSVPGWSECRSAGNGLAAREALLQSRLPGRALGYMHHRPWPPGSELFAIGTKRWVFRQFADQTFLYLEKGCREALRHARPKLRVHRDRFCRKAGALCNP